MTLEEIKGWWMWPVVFGTLLFALMLSPFVLYCPQTIPYYILVLIGTFMILVLMGIM